MISSSVFVIPAPHILIPALYFLHSGALILLWFSFRRLYSVLNFIIFLIVSPTLSVYLCSTVFVNACKRIFIYSFPKICTISSTALWILSFFCCSTKLILWLLLNCCILFFVSCCCRVLAYDLVWNLFLCFGFHGFSLFLFSSAHFIGKFLRFHRSSTLPVGSGGSQLWLIPSTGSFGSRLNVIEAWLASRV